MVCLCVCLLVTSVSCSAKTDESIEMSFWAVYAHGVPFPTLPPTTINGSEGLSRARPEKRKTEARNAESGDGILGQGAASPFPPVRASGKRCILSCYRNGNDSPHRRDVTPLLRAMSCVWRARRWSCPLSNGRRVHAPKVPVLVWGSRRPVIIVPWATPVHAPNRLACGSSVFAFAGHTVVTGRPCHCSNIAHLALLQRCRCRLKFMLLYSC